jgi:hypothetical protein
MRLRSFNAIGNPTFEVDQRNIGNTLAAVAGGTLVQDRWFIQKMGTMAVSAGQQSVPAGINLPGTNFAVTRSFFRVTLTTQEVNLAAGDFLFLQQSLEGPRWRELQNDVHSLQVLVRSSVAGLAIGVSLRDPTGAHSLTGFVTIPSANTWSLLSLPNLPLWPAGTFVNTPGSAGYSLTITLACGSTYSSPTNWIWINANFVGALGQSNFASQAVNSTFDIALVQHEPGPVCSTLIDCPFEENYDECQRYFQKSSSYGTAVGSTGGALSATVATNATYVVPFFSFLKAMAKVPTVTIYNGNSGAAGSVYNNSTGASPAVSGAPATEKGIVYLQLAATQAASNFITFAYSADTGW